VVFPAVHPIDEGKRWKFVEVKSAELDAVSANLGEDSYKA